MAHDAFGIDIGSDSIKFAYLEKRRDFYEATALHKVRVDRETTNLEGGPENIAKLAQIIQEEHKKSRIGTKNCIAAVPEEQIYSRLITLPVIEDSEQLDEAIHYSIKPLIPVPLETVSISKLLIDKIQQDGKEFANWYVVAAPLQTISKIQEIMFKAGLNLEAIETEALAATRLINLNYKIGEDVMVLDFGADSTNIILARNSSIVFSQTVSTGADSLTKVIQSDFNIDYENAEKLKVQYGLDFNAGEGKIAKAIEPVVDTIVAEISRTMAYYREKLSNHPLQKIYLTGGGANLLGLDQYIQQKLTLETINTNTLESVRISDNIKKATPDIALVSFNVAVGLALKAHLDVE